MSCFGVELGVSLYPCGSGSATRCSVLGTAKETILTVRRPHQFQECLAVQPEQQAGVRLERARGQRLRLRHCPVNVTSEHLIHDLRRATGDIRKAC